ESYINDLERVNKRIQALDNRFFDQVQTVLSDAQLVAMPRVRLARERQNHLSAMLTRMAGGMGRQTVDLSTLMDGRDFTEADRLAVNAAMSEYELRLTRLAEELSRGGGSMMLGI